MTLRTLFFDKEILSAIKAGASQVVILGAGMDCRAWRLDLPPGVGLLWVPGLGLLVTNDAPGGWLRAGCAGHVQESSGSRWTCQMCCVPNTSSSAPPEPRSPQAAMQVMPCSVPPCHQRYPAGLPDIAVGVPYRYQAADTTCQICHGSTLNPKP